MKLVITRNGNKEERTLCSEEEWRTALREYFDVMLD
jgi:hypothetical protein